MKVVISKTASVLCIVDEIKHLFDIHLAFVTLFSSKKVPSG